MREPHRPLANEGAVRNAVPLLVSRARTATARTADLRAGRTLLSAARATSGLGRRAILTMFFQIAAIAELLAAFTTELLGFL